MPRLSVLQTNFSSGELSPRLYGRTDVDKYGNAAKVMQNCHPVIHGGAVRRAGLLYAAPAKFNGARAVRLVPFVVSRDKAYMLEFGHLYVRVFLSTGAYTGVEFASPYTEEQLPDIDYVQGADTMFLFHRAVAPQRLRVFSAANWSLSAAPFGVQPFDEQGYVPYGNLILAATTGVGVVAAIDQLGVLPSPHIFLAGDVGRNLIAGSGVAVIKSVIGSSITVDILSPFATTIYGWGKWSLDASPQAFLRPSSKDTVGSTITLYASLPRVAALTLSAKTGSITITASPGVFLPSDTNQKLYADSGQATLTYISATQCSAVTSTDFASTSYSPGAWGVTDAAFRQGVDVGSFVRINGGLVKLMSIRYTEATALLVAPLTSTVAAPPLAWTLETPVWSEVYGYPRTGTLHEQRLWCAGSTKYPQTIWGSRTGLYLDFTKGVADSDACSFTIASDEQNQISYLVTARALIAHTYGGEFTVHGGNEKPITPTNVQIKAQTSHGSKGVRPLTIGKESVFVQRAGRKVRAMAYQIQSDGYSAPDLALLAEHITQSGVVGMAYQQEPDQLLWLVLADGTMVSCTLDRDQQVTGWARHYTSGAFEAVASMPIGNADQVWVVVRRTVNGTVVRYLERFDTTFEPLLPGAASPLAYPPLQQGVVYGCTVDSGVVVDNPAGQTVIGGLGHLEGALVDVLADGSVLAPLRVADGAITLPRKAYRVLAGLHFKSMLTMLSPEVGTGSGTAQGNSISVREITLRFLNTIGAQLLDGEGREQQVPFKHFGAAQLDAPPAPYSGNVRVEMLGWERGRAELSIVQNQPLPMHVLSVVRKLTVND